MVKTKDLMLLSTLAGLGTFLLNAYVLITSPKQTIIIPAGNIIGMPFRNIEIPLQDLTMWLFILTIIFAFSVAVFYFGKK